MSISPSSAVLGAHLAWTCAGPVRALCALPQTLGVHIYVSPVMAGRYCFLCLSYSLCLLQSFGLLSHTSL